MVGQAFAAYGTPQINVDASWVALAVTHSACAASGLGDHQRTITLSEKAVAMQRKASSDIGVALEVMFLADFALERGE